jgi:hypothetical protein
MARLAVREIAGFRSGDKGDLVNIAVLADDEESYAVLVRELTPQIVADHFGRLVRGRVERYEAPNVLALNFVLHEALGGGGPCTLRSDNLGKSLGGALVRVEIDVPDSLAQRRRPRPDVRWADEILAEFSRER